MPSELVETILAVILPITIPKIANKGINIIDIIKSI